AATQTAWLTGMFLWGILFFIKPRPRLVRTPLDIALWAFFGWSVISSVFSYAPLISLDKLRNVALFLIFYFVINNIRTKRAVYFLALALIFSTMVNVVWTPIERLIGRGVEIHGVKPESPLAKAYLEEGDTLLEMDGKKIRTPEELLAQIEQKESVKVKFYRPDFYYPVEVKRENLLGGATAMEKLGIGSWKKSRNWRSSGFYGHYTTYAEVLQLIASLAFGIFIAFLTQWRSGAKTRGLTIILFFCLAGMSFALLFTVTRASQLAFMISAFTIVLLGASRKMFLALLAIALPLAIGGLIFLQTSREVGFFDPKDESIRWRQTVYREGFDLWTQNARHLFLGVGMDSIKLYAKEWRLFDEGKLPMGHFHSTPLQLLVERGLPALLLWFWIVWIYGRLLIRGISDSKFQISNSKLDRGILLGCLGGLVGFFTSGLVHYNLGDAEVAMVFFLLMGLAVKIARKNEESM
ncbi:MAG TPA: O-antigen ligase family protein, partial [Pyrinomonadaceae bacterium]|nr:O-antigen ligase family protein [Pyrinomonadaceae bacterium]